MSSIKKAEEALKALEKDLRSQVPELKFSLALGVNPHNGKYTLECTYYVDPKANAILKTPIQYKGFKLNVNRIHGAENE